MRNNFYERKKNSKNYYQNNKEKLTLKKKEYNKINRGKINNRYKDKRNTNPTFKLTENLRNRTRARDWIQFQLYGEMTMKNYGKVWQIDHTLAINSFNLFNQDELRKFFNWRNLRPLYSKENMSKGDEVDERLYLLQEIKACCFLKLNDKTDSE